MKVLFTGGGTFGHVAPALAAADALKQMRPEISIAFVGRRDGAENEAIRREGFVLYELSVKSVQRRLSLKSLGAAFSTVRAVFAAGRLLEQLAPDLVFGTGGYVCYPLMRAAQKRGIPTLLHESNAIPGRACRMLAPRCTRVLLGMRDCGERLPKGTICEYTGNPIRKEFTEYTRARARRILGLTEGDLLLLSFGGSGGAERLNEKMAELMQRLCATHKNLCFVHACGRKYYDALARRYPALTARRSRARLYPFIENMPLYMHAADLCICRSGAMTVAELCAAGLPAILVPSPNVTDDHQYKNAYSLSLGGGALICTEDRLDEIEKMIEEVLFSEKKRTEMKQACSRYGELNAAKRIAKSIISCLP